MPEFSYKARRRSGELVEGVLQGADRSAAVAQIERLGLFPVAVDTSRGGPAPAKARARADIASLLPPAIRAHLQRQRKPGLQEMATFTQQLANLLQAGMPLSSALNSMTYLQTKGISSDVSRQLKQEVSEGRSLSDAMSRQPRVFSDLYVNMVRAGEQSGALVDVLRRMAEHFDRFAQVQSKFTSALVYPIIVFFAGVGLIVFFLWFVLPRFMSLFGQIGFTQLPLATLILIDISNAFTHWWWLMGLVLLTLIVLFKRFQASDIGRQKIDEWKMKLPVFGKIIRLNLYGQFARTLCTLLGNGVPVLTALKITEQ
ncbi:MAG: type II secretion system F family protein, partial [Verrucomicrobia bacterium]|nr:type II secretion system F family protein [Verrucomicrobiota bacterium]